MQDDKRISTRSDKSRRGYVKAVQLMVCVVMGLTGQALAANYTWNNGGSGTWSTSSNNWISATSTPLWDATNGGTNLAVFNTASAAATVSSTIYANGVTLENTATVSGGTITLTGTTPKITVKNAASGSTIGSVLAGTSGLRFANSDSSPSSTVQLGATAGTLAGGITVDAGVTVKQGITGSAYQFGQNALTLNGTLDLNGGYLNCSALTGSGTLDSRHASNTASVRLTGTGLANEFSGVITGKVALVWDATAAAINFSGDNYSMGQWVIRNGGTLRISSTNAYKETSGGKLESGETTGPCTVELAAGSLRINTGNLFMNSEQSKAMTGTRFAALNAERAVTWTGATVGGPATVLQWGVAASKLGRILGFGSTNATHKLIWVSGLDLYSSETTLTRQLDATGPTANPTLVVGEIAGNISDSGANAATMTLLKSGAATLILSGSNTYACATVVSNGLLLVNGSHTNGAGYSVLAGASLGGTGVVASAVSVASGGKLQAGGTNQVGTFTVSGLALVSGATNMVRITGVNGAATSKIVVRTGTIALGNATLVVDDAGLTGTVPANVTLIGNQTGAAISGTFNGLPEGASLLGSSGRRWYISYTRGVHQVTLSSIPRGTMISIF